MSEVIDLKAKRMEQAKTIAEQYMIENDFDEMSQYLVHFIDILEQMDAVFYSYLKDDKSPEAATEFANRTAALFSAFFEIMISEVENETQQPFKFAGELTEDEQTTESAYTFSHAPDVLGRFYLETCRPDGSFDLVSAIDYARELRDYNIKAQAELAKIIESLSESDPHVHIRAEE